MSILVDQLSFEFFPPKTDKGLNRLVQTASVLAQFDPDYFSVTYGAGGSTKERSLLTVLKLREEGFNTVPHLSWGTQSRDYVTRQLKEFIDHGIEEIVALRGDLPSGAGSFGQIHYARELVELIRQKTGQHFYIHVAAYPESHPDSRSPSEDLEFLRRKVQAGADDCITQYFYNGDAYINFVSECREGGIEQAIVPGIMPITNHDRLVRFSSYCGAELPRWLQEHLLEYREDEERLVSFGIEVVVRLCRQLLAAEAPGLHFYTLNHAHPTTEILEVLLNNHSAD